MGVVVAEGVVGVGPGIVKEVPALGTRQWGVWALTPRRKRLKEKLE